MAFSLNDPKQKELGQNSLGKPYLKSCFILFSVLQKTRRFQRAIFFVLLNPQTNGACFAGMNFNGNFDFENYSGFELKFKAQASNIESWKITLKTSDSVDRFTNYQQDFVVSRVIAKIL